MMVREVDFTPILPGGKFIDSREPLEALIIFAYDVKNPSKQLIGVPKWAQGKSFSVSAEPGPGFPVLPPTENREQVRLMMRSMLTERFHLQLHTEVRQEKVFRLEPAKGGIKIHEVDAPVPPAKEGRPVAVGARILGTRVTMAGLANILSLLTGAPVTDETGFKGYYDMDVRWPTDDPDAKFGSAEYVGPLVSALQNQFGLRLISVAGPVQYWVVDRADPPTEN
jgi:uncharacterized protein (TIGR03435 family)